MTSTPGSRRSAGERETAEPWHVERQLAAERRFRLVVEAAPNAVVMSDRAGVIILVNAQAERLFGYARAELIGQSVDLLVPERFRARHPGMRAAFLADPRPRPMGVGRDLFGVRKNGSEFPVEIGLNPIETDEGMLVLAAIVDITERKAAESVLRDGEHRYRSLAAIVESSDDAIIGTDLDGVVTTWNKAAERIFGYAATEMIGQPVIRLAVPGHESDVVAILDRIRQGGRADHYETTRRRKDGSFVQISLTESPIRDAAGRLVGISKVSRDVTSARMAEAALRESEARLQEVQAELAHVSRLSAMGQMAAVVAHELNQPLTAIANYMDAAAVLLDRGGALPDARLRGAIERAAEQAKRAGQIIQRLRGFASRGDSEKRFEPVPPLVREAAELAMLGARQSGIDIRVQSELPAAVVLADKIQIQQVLLNLLRNAVEAVADRQSPEVYLSAEVVGETVRISVADNGPGLPDEVRARLFEPFVSTKRSGMGIGLSICHTIVTAHDGELSAEPNPQGGTIFRVTLPVAAGTPDLS